MTPRIFPPADDLRAEHTFFGRAIDRPRPGYFAMRLVRHRAWLDLYRAKRVSEFYQPWVPALIFAPCPFVFPDETDSPYHPEWCCEPLDRSSYPLAAKIGEQVFWRDSAVLEIWRWANTITAQAYAFLMARRAYARCWQPHSYEARPAILERLK